MRTTRRRFLLGPLSLLAARPFAVAQEADRIRRIGYLATNLAAGDPRPRRGFLQALHDLGQVEGRNVLVEYRDAEGKPDRFPALAAELVALKVDVIVTTGGTVAAVAAKQATPTIPIVFAAVGDPVKEGLVASLARPGGNLTGFSIAAFDFVGKSLELLKQSVPQATRIALLFKPDTMPDAARLERLSAAAAAARALDLRLHIVEARGPDDFDRAFAQIRNERASALAVLATPVFDVERARLVDLAAKNRLPAVYSFRNYVDAGGLMSYGPDIVDLFRRSAGYVDRILRGSKPADLPVEQPTKFELVINLRTAKTLGLTIPPSLLLRADQVIE